MRLLLSQNCPQYCYKEKEEFNWWRTRWLRICDHTLTETETPPLDTAGLRCQPYGSSTCLTATPVSPITRCVTRTRRHRARDEHLRHAFMISK